ADAANTRRASQEQIAHGPIRPVARGPALDHKIGHALKRLSHRLRADRARGSESVGRSVLRRPAQEIDGPGRTIDAPHLAGGLPRALLDRLIADLERMLLRQIVGVAHDDGAVLSANDA